MRVLGYEGGRGHQHEPPVLGEERTLAVELLAARRYGHREPQLEEPVEHAVADSEGFKCHRFTGLWSLFKTMTMNKNGLFVMQVRDSEFLKNFMSSRMTNTVYSK